LASRRQQLGIGECGLARTRDGEIQPLVRRLRLEVAAQPREDLFYWTGRRARLDRAAVELADVEHGREQCGHRIERELMALEKPRQRGVRAGHALGGAVQQVQSLQRLAQVVARRREEVALLAVLFDELHLSIMRHGGVANGADDERTARRRDRAQADLYRELVAGFVSAIQRESGPHRAQFGLRGKSFTVLWMRRPESFGQQGFDRRADDFAGLVAEGLLDLRVGEHDRSVRIHDDCRVRCQIEQGSGQFAG
jgi:hypothetical protein